MPSQPILDIFLGLKMGKYDTILTAVLTSEQYTCLEEMAKSAGFLWGSHGNTSGFLRAILDGYFEIVPTDRIPPNQDCSISDDSP